MSTKKDPREFVVATDAKTGHPVRIQRWAAEADSKRYTITDRPAYDPSTGKPVPPKPKSAAGDETPPVTKTTPAKEK